jgi:CHAD domain-containing protein
VSGGPRDGTRFRQIEVELLEYASGDGRPGELAGFLERAGARPSVLSKFALATGSDLGAPAGGVEIGPDPASGFVAVIRRDLDALLLADCRLRVAADAGSDGTPGLAEAASAVAALRRLRSDLRTMEPVLDPAWSAQVAEPLRSAAASLNRLTDADSLLLRLETAAGQESGLLVGSQEPGDMDHLLQRLGSERHLRWLQTRSDLAAGSYLQTLERLREAAVRPRLTARYGPGGAPLDLLALVAANWRVVTDGLAGQGVEGDLASLRSLCGRVGRLRYSAEAAAALASRRRGSARMGRRALALQAALESVLDSARAAATLSEMATHPSCTPSAAFAAGRVSGLIEVEGRARREELPALVERLAGPRLVDWVEKVESGRR